MGDLFDSRVEVHRRDPDPHPRLRAALEARIDALATVIGGLDGGLTLATQNPTQVRTDTPGSPGVSEDAARADHTHELVLPANLGSVLALSGDGAVVRDGTTGALVAAQSLTLAETIRGATLAAGDQAGAGQRMVTALEDGTQAAVTEVTWSAGSGSADAVLFQSPTDILAYDTTSGAVVAVPSQPSFTAARLVRTSGGRYYAWSLTGRYVAWSDDDMQSWTEYDYGADLSPGIEVEICTKDSIETMLVSNLSAANTSDVRRWATLAAPPVLTATTTGIAREARPVRAAGGEPLLVGADGDDLGRIARYVASAWQEVVLTTGGGTGTVQWGTKLASGAYLVAMWRWNLGTAWIRRSTNFTTWSADIGTVSGAGSGGTASTGLLQLANGRVLWSIARGTGNQPHIWYSDDDGLTWTQATIPTVTAAAFATQFVQDANGDVYVYISDGTLLRSTDNGANWSAFATGGAAVAARPRAFGSLVSSMPLLNVDATVDVDTIRVDDQAGTGQRMVVAQADGTQRDVDEIVWDPSLWRMQMQASAANAAVNFRATNTSASGWVDFYTLNSSGGFARQAMNGVSVTDSFAATWCGVATPGKAMFVAGGGSTVAGVLYGGEALGASAKVEFGFSKQGQTGYIEADYDNLGWRFRQRIKVTADAAAGIRLLAAAADGTHTPQANAVYDGTDLTLTNLKVARRYTHVQGSPATTWTITHNLAAYPSVTVVDSGGTVGWAEIRYLSANSLEVRFASAQSGTAYLN